MSVQIDYTQVKTVEEGPRYRIQTIVNYTSGITREIFVFNTELGTFQHVATVWDMEHITPDHDLAVLEGRDFYRASACDVSYETQTTALDFADYTNNRIQDLATQYARATGQFEGTVNHHVENIP